jgi:hypothetical protein
MSEIKLCPYSAEKFVDREAEVGLVAGVLQQLRESGGTSTRQRAILFRGERGLGKTWLALHFHRTVLRKPDIRSLYISLFPLPKEYRADLHKDEWAIDTNLPKQQHEKTCQALMKWICDALVINYVPEPTLAELKMALVSGVEKKFKGAFLVFVLDSVFECGWELSEVVEKNLLAPLAMDFPALAPGEEG